MPFSWEQDEQQTSPAPQPQAAPAPAAPASPAQRFSWDNDDAPSAPLLQNQRRNAPASGGMRRFDMATARGWSDAWRDTLDYATRRGRYENHDTMPTAQALALEDGDTYAGPVNLTAIADNAVDLLSLGTSDEIFGVGAGLGAGRRGETFSQAYHSAVDAARARMARSREQSPLASLGGMILGGLVAARQMGPRAPMGGGGGLNALASGRGWRALGSQSLIGMGRGALAGATYGYASSTPEDEANLVDQNRVMGGAWGGVTGGVLGGLAPSVTQATGHRFGALRGVGGGALGAAGGAMLSPDDPLSGAIGGAAVGAGAAVAGKPLIERYGPAIQNTVSNVLGRTPWATQRFAGTPNAIIPGGLPGGGGGGGAAAAAPPAGPQIPRSVVTDVDRALERSRGNVQNLTEGVAAAQADSAADIAAGRPVIDRRLADLTEEFSADVDSIANQPGQTFTRARQIATNRAQRMPEDLQTELRQSLGVRMSPTQAMAAVTDERGQASRAYNQLLNNARIDPRQVASINRIMADDPIFQNALRQFALADRRAFNQAVREAERLGLEPPRQLQPSVIADPESGLLQLAPNVSARRLHRLKTAVDDEIDIGRDRTDDSAIRKGEFVEDVSPLYQDFLDAIDNAVEGYAEVRARYGSMFDARRALGVNREGVPQMGRKLLAMRPEEIERHMREVRTETGRVRPTTEFEREMYRISVADEVMRKIEDRATGSSDKVRNAQEAIDSMGLQNRLRAVFNESPEAVDTFLARATERGENLRRAAGWTGNSASARRLTRAGDRFLATLSNLGGQAARGDPAGAAQSAGGMGLNALLGRHVERQNDLYGDALLRDLGDQESQAYMRALLKELRALEDARMRRPGEAAREGLLGGIGGGGYDDLDQY